MRQAHGLSQDQVDSLGDTEFCQLAAEAYFRREQQAEAVKAGVLGALGEILQRVKTH